jgi:replicative DNA helicase
MLDVAHDDRQKDFKSIEDVLFTELDKLERLSREGTSLTGTPSGFKALDDITGGFQPGNLVIIAGRPSMGESALVTNIAENVALDHGKPVALFSLERDALGEQIGERTVSRLEEVCDVLPLFGADARRYDPARSGSAASAAR